MVGVDSARLRILAWVGLAIIALGCGAGDPPCKVTVGSKGERILRCPDGEVSLPPMNEGEPFGTLRGSIRRFGYDVNPGIMVEMGGVNVALQTESDGSWLLRDLPVGWYSATFSYAGYESVKWGSIPVIPGVHSLEDVELKIGTRLLDGEKWMLIPSPDEKGALAWEPGGGRLIWIDPKRSDPLWLGTSVATPMFNDDGSKVLYLDGVLSGGMELMIFETDTRTRTTIADKVDTLVPGPGFDTVAYRRTVDGQQRLEVWNHPARKRAAVAMNPRQWEIGPGGRTLLARISSDAQTLVVWDVASETGSVLHGVSDGLPEIAPDGISFVFETMAGDSLLWHGARNEALPLGGTPRSSAFSADGSRLQVLQQDGTLYHWDLGTASKQEVASDAVFATYSPDGQRLAFVRHLGDGRQQIRIWDRATRESVRVTETPGLLDLMFAPDGSGLFFVHLGDERAFRLSVWREESGIESIGASDRLPLFSPDRSAYVFFQENGIWYREARQGAQPIELLTPAFLASGWPVGWSESHVWASDYPFHAGPLRVLDRRTGNIVLNAEKVYAPSIRADADGGLLYLEDANPREGRGRLVRWQDGDVQALHTGVRFDATHASPALPLTATADGRRSVFQSDVWPVRAPRILALFDNSLEAPVPIDSHVYDAVVGTDYLLWVVNDEKQGDDSRSGIYLSSFPPGALASEFR